MAKGYWIATYFSVSNPDALAEYAKLAGPAITAGGGRFLARGNAAKAPSNVFPYAELEARIARRDFRNMTKDVLPTPCMLVDLPLLLRDVPSVLNLRFHCS